MPETQFPVLMFAAGFGTRMKALTRDRPKPLIHVAGKPLIDHTIALARDAGCAPLVANLHYKAGMMIEHLAPQGVQTVVERPDILETGGGLRNAVPLLGDGPVVTMNTDVIWVGANPIKMVMDAWQPEKMDGLLMCVPVAQAHGYKGEGDFLLSKDGRIERGPRTVYGGIQIIKTALLDQIDERSFSLNLLWDMMLDRNRLFGMRYSGRWCDVGHPAGITLAEEMLENAGV